jgi:hypothetical protein
MHSGNLLWPAGPIQAAWFTADQEPADILNSWIAQAEQEGAATDDQVTTFVEFKTYTMLANRLAHNPSAESFGERSLRHDSSQLAHWQRLADTARTRWEAITGRTTSAGVSGPASNSFVY